jgi:hypothetical protein
MRRIEVHGYNEETGKLEDLTSGPAYVALGAVREYFMEVVKISTTQDIASIRT